MICKNCGSKVDDSAKFCIYCGSRLSDESVEYKEEVLYNDVPEEKPEPKTGQSTYEYGAGGPDAASQQPKNVYTYDAGAEGYGNKKSNTGKIVLAVVLIVVLVLVASLIKIGLGLLADRDNYNSGTDDPTSFSETYLELNDTDEFAEFMMGEWSTKLGGNFFEVSADDEYYYFDTDLPLERNEEYSWYVMSGIMYIYYDDDDMDEPYLLFNVTGEDTVEVYSFQEDYTRVFHRK